MWLRRRASEQGASQVLSLMVGAIVVFGAIGAVLYATSEAGNDVASGTGTNPDAVASLLVDSPGKGLDLQNGTVDRLGLRTPGTPYLDARTLAALRNAELAANASNQRIEYAEARASLGLTRQDFRIVMAPVDLSSELAALDLSDLQVAYIGRWGTTPTALVADADEATMASEARSQMDSTIGAAAQAERVALADIGTGFDDRVHLDASALDAQVDREPRVHIRQAVSQSHLEGDVFIDRKQYLTEVLPARLQRYDVLIVGSRVQHEALTSDPVKTGIRDWVLAGGVLIVMGTDAQSIQWIQPLFQVGTSPTAGAVHAPDAAHHLLQQPHALSWPSYPRPTRAWSLDAAAPFERVLVSGGGGDLLASSRPGAFGDGRIVLSAFQPGTFAGADGPLEARHFFHNAIVSTDRSHLYLDYGPPLPWGIDVGSASRQALLVDPELGLVAVQVQVLTWRTG